MTVELVSKRVNSLIRVKAMIFIMVNIAG